MMRYIFSRLWLLVLVLSAPLLHAQSSLPFRTDVLKPQATSIWQLILASSATAIQGPFIAALH